MILCAYDCVSSSSMDFKRVCSSVETDGFDFDEYESLYGRLTWTQYRRYQHVGIRFKYVVQDQVIELVNDLAGLRVFGVFNVEFEEWWER